MDNLLAAIIIGIALFIIASKVEDVGNALDRIADLLEEHNHEG